MKSKILLIEDDKDQIDIYTIKFTMEGFDFIVASNGPEGLIKAEQENPNLILLDVILFEMNGMEVLQRLKKNPKTKHIPVILLTNLAKKDLAEKGKKLGAINYVIKTNVTLKDLVQMVKENIKI